MARSASVTTRRRPVAFIVCLVMAAIVFGYGGSAFAAISVSLKSAHVGANSQSYGQESGDGGLTSPVVWHFVLNGLSRGTQAGTITATFGSAGSKSATGRPSGNGSTQHFYIGTSGHDVLTGASAVVESAVAGQLVLSHVRVEVVEEPPGEEPPGEEPPGEEPPGEEPPGEEPPGEEPPGEEPPGEEPPGEEPPGEEPPGEEPPGEEPPGEEPPGEEPPGEEPPGEEPPGEEPPGEEPPGEEASEDDPFLPYSETADVDEPFLPFTGITGEWLGAFAIISSAGGLMLRAFSGRAVDNDEAA